MIYGNFPFREISAGSSESDENNMKNISRYAQDPSQRVTSEGTDSRNVLSQRWIADNRNGILSKVHSDEDLMEFTKNELRFSEEKFDREEEIFEEQRRRSFAERMAQRNQQNDHANSHPKVVTVTREPGQTPTNHPNGYKTVIRTPGNTN
ncbi:hypothetical protein Ddc_18865 [Ditylenchus destructor]|nr:hypothetical protein Ddc_18865 [Ditylenchus destructor]